MLETTSRTAERGELPVHQRPTGIHTHNQHSVRYREQYHTRRPDGSASPTSVCVCGLPCSTPSDVVEPRVQPRNHSDVEIHAPLDGAWRPFEHRVL